MPSVKEDRTFMEVQSTVQLVIEALRGAGIKHRICGSLRRGEKTVVDIDIAVVEGLPRVCAALSGSAYLSFFDRLEKRNPEYKFKMVTKKKLQQAKRMDVLIDDIPFSLHTATRDQWGAMLLFLTGNSTFNIKMRALAKQEGMKLNQYGLWHGHEIIAGMSETQIFNALGLDYIPPEERTVFKNQRL